MSDSEVILQQRVVDAGNKKQQLAIIGGMTKDFYGRAVVGETLDIKNHQGIVDYDPTELVLTAKAGTPMVEVNRLLEENNQMLGFEPPYFGKNATLGGTIACGLSGPARPFRGSVRDFVLGVKILTGSGHVLKFGGRVMKNVAGFDVSRLMVGAMGTLGVILEVSIKVLPKPASQITISIHQPNVNLAIQEMNRLHGKPWPISAMSWYQDRVWIRLSGTDVGVTNAYQHIGGDLEEAGDQFWEDSREQSLPFFRDESPLLRVSCKAGVPGFDFQNSALDQDKSINEALIEWAGGVRWFKQSEAREANFPERLQEKAKELKGHMMWFRGGNRQGEVFMPLPSAVLTIQKNLKRAFDPQGILNVGRLYASF
ncbi:MAG: glycolate oxidase subunit GlcE [Gammaproteobacteria bacterium]|nr:glycolate oxidase subunit GlcE [Gammaproteobacteria bacterium]